MTLPSPQSRQRAVVTGGAGFLGSHLCERLLMRGFHVICLDNLVTGSVANVAHLTASPHFTMIRVRPPHRRHPHRTETIGPGSGYA